MEIKFNRINIKQKEKSPIYISQNSSMNLSTKNKKSKCK